MRTYLLQVLARLISAPIGGINSAIGLFVGTMQQGFQSAIQFHKEGIAFARDMGMSAKQAQAYTDTLISRTQVLANRYGVSAEAIMQVQRGLSEATGKQLMLNDAQAEGFVQIDKLIGAQARSKFTEEIMNGMGGQIDTVQGAIAKVYATASKQGLNAKKLSDKVAQNLSMANRLSFRNGIDGITRMAALSEKLGINMQSVESAASSFLELDKAIENAAKMQMLGGSAAAMFGNPLTAAYEANYDPEAFAKRMSDSLASYATFDAQKGIANINGMNMDFVRAIGKAMGISAEDAAKMAKKQAEVRFKERQFSPMLDRYGLTEEQKNYLINNGQVRNGNLFYTDAKGVEHNISQGDVNKTLLEEIRKFEGMSDKDIMIEQTQKLISIDENITGAATTVAASFAKGIDQYLPDIGKKIQALGDYFSEYAQQWGKDTGKAIGKAMAWINANGSKIRTVADFILGTLSSLISTISENLKTTVAILIAWKLFGVGNLLRSGLGRLFGRLGGGAVGGTTSRAATFTSASQKLFGKETTRRVNQSYKLSRNMGRGRLRAGYNATKNLYKNSKWFARGVKGSVGIGTLIAGAEMASSFYNYSKKKDEINANARLNEQQKNKQILEAKKERNEAVGGSAGALALGLAGAKAGAVLGAAGGPIGILIGGLAGGLIGGIGGAFAGEAIGRAISKDPNEVEHHAQGGVVGGRGGEDSTPAMLTPGEIVLSETMQKNLVSLLKNPPIQVKPVGEKEYIYVPKSVNTTNVGGNTVTVKDFNVNLSGTIKLDGGNSMKNIDVKSLLNDYQFVNSLKQIIKDSINSDMNGGRYMTDVSTLRGHTTSSSVLGR